MYLTHLLEHFDKNGKGSTADCNFHQAQTASDEVKPILCV